MTAAQKYIEKLNSEYISNHISLQERDMLISENEVEQKDVKGYHGREILELLQNADDAYQKAILDGVKPKDNLEVLLKFDGDILSIANTGTYFDDVGIKAIIQGNNSSKDSGKYIGNKGTGFRSVLNWADEIKIHSGEYNLLFSKDIAERKFQEIKSHPQIKKQIEKQADKNRRLYLPILAMPENIEKIQSPYDTTIQIKINSEKNSDGFGVKEQIESIDLRFLLFLPNIDKIIIKLFDQCIVYKRKVESNDFKEIILSKYINGKTELLEHYYLFEKVHRNKIVEDEEKKDVLFSVAVPKDSMPFENSNIYSFFPLQETKSPFNCILHASYELGNNRNTLTKGSINEQIIKYQLQFLKEVALNFAKKEYGNMALDLLTPIGIEKFNWKFNIPFDKFSLEEYYLKLLADAKVLRTVNDEYISINDMPKILRDTLPSVFNGDVFSNILKPFTTNNVEGSLSKLIREISKIVAIDINYLESDLLTAINLQTDKWTISQQVEVFIWWNKNNYTTLPNLLKTQDGKWITYKQECYFLIGDINENIPQWVKVPSLHKKYQEELFIQCLTAEKIIELKKIDKETPISRLISQNNVFGTVTFTYRDRSNIVTTVNSSVDTYEKSVEFINWLWKYYSQDVDWMPPKGSERSPVRYKFPDYQKKAIRNSETIYLGNAYGNMLSDKLFDESYSELPALDLFDIKEEDKNQFIDFILKFDVKNYPIIIFQRITPLDEYSMYYKSKIKPLPDLNSCESFDIKYILPDIINLEKILKKLSTYEIILWLKEDYRLKTFLRMKFLYENVSVEYIGNRQQYYRKYNGEIRNYLLFFFNNAKWIEIEGKRYAPIEILNAIDSKTNADFKSILPVLTNKIIVNIAENTLLKYDEIIDIFELFALCDKPTDLQSNNFYDLLLKLPNHEFLESEKLSKTIYRIIEQHNFTKTFHDSANKRKFFEEGQVLTQFKGKLQYHLANESFLPSSKIVVKRNIPIVEKRQRTNNVNFKNILGCKEYEQDYIIIKDTIKISVVNSKFQDYYSDFLEFASAYSERNNNISTNINKLKITIVSYIELLENNKVSYIDENYITLRESTTQWYIVIVSDEFDTNTLSVEIENIFGNIANTPGFDEGKLGEIFRANERKNREFLILKEFGTMDVVENKTCNNHLKFNFIETVKNCNCEIDIESYKIDFDDFASLESIRNIIELLKTINVDIDDFDKAGFSYKLDLIPFFKSELINFIHTEKKNYINYIFCQALEHSDLRLNFIQKKQYFMSFQINNYYNSIHFNIKEEVEKIFGEWENSSSEDADSTYEKNYTRLNPENLYADSIANTPLVQTMIYFNECAKFNEWVDVQRRSEEKEQKKKLEDPYEKIRRSIPSEQDIEYTKEKISAKKQSSRGGSYSYAENERRSRAKKILGNKGELLIYNLLCEEFGENNVAAISEAFVDLGILKAGQGVSGQYDISYKNRSGKEIFVEVKTGNEKSFIITHNELQFAKENPERFELYLVYDVDKEEPKYKKMPHKFWNNKKFRLKEIVERIEVDF